MRHIINKIKSNVLTYLFKDWIENEFDLETLMLSKAMISNREYELKWAIDKMNHVEIRGFRSHKK